MTADDLPPFPEIPLSPEQKLRWADWGRRCMAIERERCAKICEALDFSQYEMMTRDIAEDCAAAIRSELQRNQEG